jgi:hypothetical protein
MELLERLASALGESKVHRTAVVLSERFYSGELALPEVYEIVDHLEAAGEFPLGELRAEFEKVSGETAERLVPA